MLTPRVATSRAGLYVCGSTLIALHGFLYLLSSRFLYEISLAAMPIRTWVSLEILAGLIFLGAVWLVVRTHGIRNTMLWIVVVGSTVRGLFFFSTPVLEDDYYRYFWDGAVTAAGANPYRYAPADIRTDNGAEPSQLLRNLGRESEPVISRINHPDVHTIYPPVAQAAFAVSYLAKPFDPLIWRLLLLTFDLCTLLLIMLLLRVLSLRPEMVLIYWWNPVVIKETFNSMHMDVLTIPFVLAAVYVFIRHYHKLAAVLIAVAAGIKLWPVGLIPVLFSSKKISRRQMIAAMLIFALVLALLLLPMLRGPLDDTAGIVAYASNWQMNGLLFQWLHGLYAAMSTSGDIVTRWTVVVLLIGLILYVSRRRADSTIETLDRLLLCVAAMYLLSPTGYPWYYQWLVPWLVFVPRWSLLLPVVLLPLYYLRFYYDASGSPAFFDQVVVPLEFLPVWVLLAWEWRAGPQISGQRK